MASTIKVKRSAVSGNAPNTSNIDTGELALNTADGILYSSDGSSVFEIGANLTSLAVSGQVSLTSNISANGSIGSAGQALLTDGSSKVYWGTVASSGGGGSSGSTAGTRVTYYYTANEGDTEFSGADDNATVADLDVGHVDVFLNGILISPSNYTSNTTAVVFSSAVSNNDIVTIVASDVVFSATGKTYVYSANGTQTVFEGPDLSSQTLSITTDYYDVYVNGILIWDSANNYTSNSTAVTFQTTLAEDDLVTIKTYLISTGQLSTGIEDNSTATTITINSDSSTTFGGHILPSANVTYDLGSTTQRWRDLYLSGTSIELGGATITASGSSVVLPAGSTISGGSGAVVDLDSAQTLTNKTLTSPVISTITNTGTLTLPTSTGTVALTSDISLDTLGITANTTEINYIDGVTSSIQTQLNLKVDETASDGSAIIPSGNTAQRDSSPQAGYLRFNSEDSSFEGYDGSAWGAIGGGGVNNQKLDDISSGFDGANTDFTLAVSSSAVEPGSVNNVLISINGVVQEPTTTYTISGSTITFTTAPEAGDTFFGLFFGTLSINVPGDGTVGTDQLSSANVAFDTSTLFIDSTNNRVGVGTITPATALDVTGTITADGLMVDGDVEISSTGPVLYFMETDTTDVNIRAVSSSGKFYLQSLSDDKSTIKSRFQIDNATGDISFYEDTGTSQKFFWDAADERLGIGTTSPISILETYNTSSAAILSTTTTGYSGFRARSTSGNFYSFIDDSTGSAFSTGAYSRVFWSDGAYPMVFGTNAAEAMRIDSSGNIIIGDTSNNGRKFRVKGSGDLVELVSTNAGAGGAQLDLKHESASAANGDLVGIINFSGLDSGSQNTQYASIQGVASDISAEAGELRLGVRESSSTYNADAVVIDSSGNLLVGTTSVDSNTTGHGLLVNNVAYHTRAGSTLLLNRLSTDGDIAVFRKDGTTVGSVSVTSSGTTYNTTSDIRLKTDIQPISDATDKLMSMNPVKHKWIADPEADAVHGFIAQEMMNVVPEAVSGDPEGEEMMSMDYGRITPVLVAALQDAIKEITALKERLSELEAK